MEHLVAPLQVYLVFVKKPQNILCYPCRPEEIGIAHYRNLWVIFELLDSFRAVQVKHGRVERGKLVTGSLGRAWSSLG